MELVLEAESDPISMGNNCSIHSLGIQTGEEVLLVLLTLEDAAQRRSFAFNSEGGALLIFDLNKYMVATVVYRIFLYYFSFHLSDFKNE